jgi:hypothetical protein
LSLKIITQESDIDKLKIGEVVGINPFANSARFAGIHDNLFVFTYRAGERINEVWLERNSLSSDTDLDYIGKIKVKSQDPIEPIEYMPKKNAHLYRTKDLELCRVGL